MKVVLAGYYYSTVKGKSDGQMICPFAQNQIDREEAIKNAPLFMARHGFDFVAIEEVENVQRFPKFARPWNPD